jgi:deoxyguanosine kinase
MVSAPGKRYIAVDGPPGAGVTAMAHALVEATGAQLVADPGPGNPFRDDFARDPRRFGFQTQVYCLLTRYRQQVELAQPDLFGPGDLVADYVFARDAVYAGATLRPDEYLLYERIHGLLDARLPTPDLVVYLTADTDVLRARIRKQVTSADRVIKLGVIDELARAMDELFFSYADGPLLTINTSAIDIVENRDQLAELVEVIRRTRAGVHHYRPMATG